MHLILDKTPIMTWQIFQFLKQPLNIIFSVWISEKQSSLNGDNQAAPLMDRRQPAIVFPAASRRLDFTVFLEIQKRKKFQHIDGVWAVVANLQF